jgi:polar amino acid transport system substrate-binding protein
MKVIITTILLLIATANAAAKTLKICGTDWPPSTIVENNQITKGYSVEIYKEAFKRLQMDFEINIVPWKRCIKWVTAGTYDAVIDTSAANKGLIIGQHPNSFSQLAIYVRQDSPETQYIPENLTKHWVGIVRGYTNYLKVAKENNWKAKEALNEENMFTMLNKGRFNYAFSDIRSTQALSKKLGIQFKRLKPLVVTDTFYLGFSPNNKALSKRYDATLGEMIKEGFLDKVYKKYLSKTYQEMLMGE